MNCTIQKYTNSSIIFNDKYIIRYIINLFGEYNILSLLLTSKIFFDAYTFGKCKPIISKYENFCSNKTIFRWMVELGCKTILKGSMLNCVLAKNGYLDMLKWARKLRVPFDWNENVYICAIINNHMEIIQWLRAQNPPCPWDEKVIAFAVKQNKFEIVKWLHENKCPWDETCCKIAAETGNLNLLKWLRTQDPPCPWNRSTTSCAALNNKLDVIVWALEQNPPCQLDISSCAYAALNGHFDVLKLLRNRNPPCPWNELVFMNACVFGNLDIVKWMRNQDPPCNWSPVGLNRAIKYGHIDLVKWLIEHNCPMDDYAVINACERNKFDILVWMHETRHIALNSMCYMGAAINGNLTILKWLHEHSCPWDDDIILNAILSEDPDTFLWAWNNRNPSHVYNLFYFIQVSKNVLITNHLMNFTQYLDDSA